MKYKIQPHRENNVKSYIRSDDVNLKQKDTIQLFANMEFKLLHWFVFVRNSDSSIKNHHRTKSFGFIWALAQAN